MSDHLHYIQEFPCNVWNPPIFSTKWFGLFFPFSSSNNLSATKWSYSWLKTGWAFSIYPNSLSDICPLQPHASITFSSPVFKTLHHEWAGSTEIQRIDREKVNLLFIQQTRLPHAAVQPVWHQLGYIPGGIWVHVPAGGIPGVTGCHISVTFRYRWKANFSVSCTHSSFWVFKHLSM